MTTFTDTGLTDIVARAVHERTGGRLRDASVTATEDTIIVRGVAPTFYLKQMALEAARVALRGLPLCLRLEITVHAR
jgi:hypothetical protein